MQADYGAFTDTITRDVEVQQKLRFKEKSIPIKRRDFRSESEFWEGVTEKDFEADETPEGGSEADEGKAWEGVLQLAKRNIWKAEEAIPADGGDSKS